MSALDDILNACVLRHLDPSEARKELAAMRSKMADLQRRSRILDVVQAYDLWAREGRSIATLQNTVETLRNELRGVLDDEGGSVMADAVDWHGWRFGKGNFTVHICQYPRRKAFALALESSGSIDVLAYFRSEEHARKAQAIFDGIADRMNGLEKQP